MMMTQGLTIEPNKPRVCWRGFDHNRATIFRDRHFEGLGCVRENIRGGPAQHDNIDEKSGCDNNGLHAACLKLDGVCLCAQWLPVRVHRAPVRV